MSTVTGVEKMKLGVVFDVGHHTNPNRTDHRILADHPAMQSNFTFLVLPSAQN